MIAQALKPFFMYLLLSNEGGMEVLHPSDTIGKALHQA